MGIKQRFKNLQLYHKLFSLTLLITFFVLCTTAGFNFFLHSKLLTDQMTSRAEGLASLWKTTIAPEDIEKALGFIETSHPAKDRLIDHVSLVHEQNSSVLGAYLMTVDDLEAGRFKIIAASRHYNDFFNEEVKHYNGGPEFISAFTQSMNSNSVSSTSVYRDQFGTWITAFAPIKNQNGAVIALLGIDLDASILKRSQAEILLLLACGFIAVSLIVYFVLRWGLKKVLQPVDDIVCGIKQVSAGNFNVSLPIHDQSDLGQLSLKFNEMTVQLSTLFATLTAASDQLKTIKEINESTPLLETAIGQMESLLEHTKVQKELQHAEKMNAIGQLAASVAHEIRNPLTVVKGFLQIFSTKEKMSKEEVMFIGLMIEEINRAESIINDYLELAKPDMAKSERIDGSDLTVKAIDLMSTYAMMSKNIVLRSDIQPNVNVKGSKNELKQVLINILKNGIEAMKEGGELELTLKDDGRNAIFTISDTGIGMTAEELDRLGTAFYSLKEKGTGMGLMVCYQIIERMRGRIEVYSNKGEGTTFKVYVPLAEDEEEN